MQRHLYNPITATLFLTHSYPLSLVRTNLYVSLSLSAGFIGEGKSALTDEEITVLVSCADKDGNGTSSLLSFFLVLLLSRIFPSLLYHPDPLFRTSYSY